MHTLSIILLVISLLLLIFEFITKRGIFIWPCLGLLVTIIANMYISSIKLLIIIFMLTTIGLYILLRKWYRTYILPARVYESELPIELVGKNGIVVKKVSLLPQITGRVEIDNERYVAVTKISKIYEGEEVVVTSVEDNKIFVKRKLDL